MTEVLLTTQTPVVTDQSDGGSPGVSVATTESCAVDALLVGIRFYGTVTVGGVYTGEAWFPTVADGAGGAGAGTRQAFKVSGAPATASAWNVIMFDTPLMVPAGQWVRCVANNSLGRYVFTQGFFNAAGLVNGNISAYKTGETIPGLGVMRQGSSRTNVAPNAYPTNSFDGSCYFVGGIWAPVASVVLTPAAFTLAAPAVTPVPGTVTVALAPAALTLTAAAVTPVSGLVTVPLTPALLSFVGVPLGVPGRLIRRPDTGRIIRPDTGRIIRP